MNDHVFVDSMLVSASLGFFLGLSELVNRYTSFKRIFKNKYSWIYMAINLVASSVVYIIIKRYKLNLGSLGENEIGISIFAGLGAMAFLRSSFFNYKTATGQVIAVGPAAILTVFLRAAELEFDRIVSEENVKRASGLMKEVKFISAAKDLPIIILASMQALSSDEQKTLSDDILKLVNDTTATTEAKNIALGLTFIKYTGYDLLATSVQALKVIYDKTTTKNLEKISTLQERLKKL